ncbi:MAG: gas vesicle protein GvpN [Clostridia bacterium]|nr:gas vesicle protein GvpN [Clostridia bacterium]
MQPSAAPDTAALSPDERGFVETPAVRTLVERALLYLRCGFPVHFCGPSGTGKTATALYVARRLGRPVVLYHGDEALQGGDLVGGFVGYHYRRVVDNFIRSVVKTQEDLDERWVDNPLTAACRYGYTLVYDEFTRSRPETNNVLLSVLEERVLTLPPAGGRERHVAVHPDFRAIFTSNPTEYAGVHRPPDALLHRMITLRMDDVDEATAAAIVAAREGLSGQEAAAVVRTVLGTAPEGRGAVRPSLRACLMLARVLRAAGARPEPGDPVFAAACRDILGVG